MSDKSGIQWTEATWNPVTGCSKVSQGCKNCYALRDWPRLSAPRPKPNVYTGREFTDVMCHPERLDQPLRWGQPRRVFVNSMSDLFHEDVPEEFIDRVFAVMALCPHHTFQILTKRPERMRDYMLTPLRRRRMAQAVMCISNLAATAGRDRIKLDAFGKAFPPGDAPPWPHIWLGVSVEDQPTADERILLLLQTPAAVRFVSYEPALGPVDFDDIVTRYPKYEDHRSALYCDVATEDDEEFGGATLDWIIVGGESGPLARACDILWIRSAIEQCKLAGVACFVKQLGASPVSNNMFDFPATWAPDLSEPIALELSDRKGGDMAEWPEDLRVREFPR